jgi:hypothetical protein
MLLVLALVLPLFLKGPAGRPIMVVDDWLQMPGRVGEFLGKGRSVLEAAAPADGPGLDLGRSAESALSPEPEGKYYRWQDERGRWHFSDQPPPEGISAQHTPLPQVRNSVTASLPLASDTTGTAPSMDSNIARAVTLPEGVSPEDMEKMLEEAHQRRMGEEL